MSQLIKLVLLVATVAFTLPVSHAQTPHDWIKLGERVHGGFGAFIPVGIRIGQDALQRLKLSPAKSQ
jgi:hypothetical protein